MSEKSILITGAAKRVGSVLAKYFAERGYNIALHYNHSRAEAEKVAEEIRALGREAEIFQSDLANVSTLDPLMQAVLERFPQCNTLIHNASVFTRAAFLETSPELFDEQMNVNLKAPFFLTQSFAKRVASGNVAVIVDADIIKHTTNYSAYLLSKKALYELIPMLATALAPHIRVNGVSPGILLPSGEDFGEEYMREKATKIPLKKHATPEDIARAIEHLFSGFYTGQCLFVDGGASWL